jgi:hypothetical protein
VRQLPAQALHDYTNSLDGERDVKTSWYNDDDLVDGQDNWR